MNVSKDYFIANMHVQTIDKKKLYNALLFAIHSVNNTRLYFGWHLVSLYIMMRIVSLYLTIIRFLPL